MTAEEIEQTLASVFAMMREKGVQRLDSQLFAEHFHGFYNFYYYPTLIPEDKDYDATVVRLDSPSEIGRLLGGEPLPAEMPYANVDYDARCDCCGEIAMLGSVDFFTGKEGEAAQVIAQRYADFQPVCTCKERFGS